MVRRMKNEFEELIAYTSQAGVVPALSTMPKDHKPLDENNEPKTRPVFGANTSANGRLNDIASDVLEKVADANTDIENPPNVYRRKKC